MSTKATKVTSIRMPSQLNDDIKELATRYNRTENEQMVWMLDQFTRQEQEKEQKRMNRPCIIGVGLPPHDHEAIKNGLDYLHALFSHADGKQEQAGFNVLCAGPKNGLTYDEAFILCQKRFFEVGWVYADTAYEVSK